MRENATKLERMSAWDALLLAGGGCIWAKMPEGEHYQRVECESKLATRTMRIASPSTRDGARARSAPKSSSASTRAASRR